MITIAKPVHIQAITTTSMTVLNRPSLTWRKATGSAPTPSSTPFRVPT
jgi:hypothetical protein